MSQAREGNFSAIVVIEIRPTLGGSNPDGDPPHRGYSSRNGAGVWRIKS